MFEEETGGTVVARGRKIDQGWNCRERRSAGLMYAEPLGREAGVWQRNLPYAGFVAQAAWQYQESARAALLTARLPS